MDWIIELLLALFGGSGREDRSVVGKSRLDEESSRLWTWIGIAAIVLGTVIWLVTRS